MDWVAARRILGMAALAAQLGACQTGAPRMDGYEVPAVFLPSFQPCMPSDGAAALQISQDGALLGTANLEWIAKTDDTLKAQITNPLGGTVAQLDYQSGSGIRITSRSLKDLPALGLTEKGFIEADGHFTGLRAAEIGCILGARLPKSWLPFVTAGEERSESQVFWFDDGARVIRVTMTPPAKLKAGHASACIRISWRQMLVLRREIKWCLFRANRARSELSGLDGYEIKWTELDE